MMYGDREYMELQDLLHSGLGRAIAAWGQLEFNFRLALTYCLADDEDAGSDNASTYQRTERLREILLKRFATSDEAIRAIEGWFAEARDVRLLRNDLVHGRWAVLGSGRIMCAPVNAPLEPGSERQWARSEFISEVERFEQLGRKFGKLRRKLNF